MCPADRWTPALASAGLDGGAAQRLVTLVEAMTHRDAQSAHAALRAAGELMHAAREHAVAAHELRLAEHDATHVALCAAWDAGAQLKRARAMTPHGAWGRSLRALGLDDSYARRLVAFAGKHTREAAGLLPGGVTQHLFGPQAVGTGPAAIAQQARREREARARDETDPFSALERAERAKCDRPSHFGAKRSGHTAAEGHARPKPTEQLRLLGDEAALIDPALPAPAAPPDTGAEAARAGAVNTEPAEAPAPVANAGFVDASLADRLAEDLREATARADEAEAKLAAFERSDAVGLISRLSGIVLDLAELGDCDYEQAVRMSELVSNCAAMAVEREWALRPGGECAGSPSGTDIRVRTEGR